MVFSVTDFTGHNSAFAAKGNPLRAGECPVRNMKGGEKRGEKTGEKPGVHDQQKQDTMTRDVALCP
jgi:hypothetical protein